MIQLYVKKSTLNITKFVSLKKIHTKIIIIIIIVKKSHLELNDLELLCYSAKGFI